MSLKYRLYISPEKCIGCRTCELGCSFSHNKDFKPSRSRVNVLTLDDKPIKYYPILCLQCENAACAEVCPTHAIWWNKETGALEVKKDRCINCLACVAACPFGNMIHDEIKDEPIKCDLCGGNPVCAMFCPTKALEYKAIE